MTEMQDAETIAAERRKARLNAFYERFPTLHGEKRITVYYDTSGKEATQHKKWTQARFLRIITALVTRYLLDPVSRRVRKFSKRGN